MAESKASELPRYEAIAMRSPVRAWARARVQPHIRPQSSITAGHPCDVSRSLPVPKLPDVIVAFLPSEAATLPPEKDVASCLHQPLPTCDSLPVVGKRTLRGEPVQDGGF